MPGDLRGTNRGHGVRGTSRAVALGLAVCLAGLALSALLVLLLT